MNNSYTTAEILAFAQRGVPASPSRALGTSPSASMGAIWQNPESQTLYSSLDRGVANEMSNARVNSPMSVNLAKASLQYRDLGNMLNTAVEENKSLLNEITTLKNQLKLEQSKASNALHDKQQSEFALQEAHTQLQESINTNVMLEQQIADLSQKTMQSPPMIPSNVPSFSQKMTENLYHASTQDMQPAATTRSIPAATIRSIPAAPSIKSMQLSESHPVTSGENVYQQNTQSPHAMRLDTPYRPVPRVPTQQRMPSPPSPVMAARKVAANQSEYRRDASIPEHIQPARKHAMTQESQDTEHEYHETQEPTQTALSPNDGQNSTIHQHLRDSAQQMEHQNTLMGQDNARVSNIQELVNRCIASLPENSLQTETLKEIKQKLSSLHDTNTDNIGTLSTDIQKSRQHAEKSTEKDAVAFHNSPEHQNALKVSGKLDTEHFKQTTEQIKENSRGVNQVVDSHSGLKLSPEIRKMQIKASNAIEKADDTKELQKLEKAHEKLQKTTKALNKESLTPTISLNEQSLLHDSLINDISSSATSYSFENKGYDLTGNTKKIHGIFQIHGRSHMGIQGMRGTGAGKQAVKRFVSHENHEDLSIPNLEMHSSAHAASDSAIRSSSYMRDVFPSLMKQLEEGYLEYKQDPENYQGEFKDKFDSIAEKNSTPVVTSPSDLGNHKIPCTDLKNPKKCKEVEFSPDEIAPAVVKSVSIALREGMHLSPKVTRFCKENHIKVGSDGNLYTISEGDNKGETKCTSLSSSQVRDLFHKINDGTNPALMNAVGNYAAATRAQTNHFDNEAALYENHGDICCYQHEASQPNTFLNKTCKNDIDLLHELTPDVKSKYIENLKSSLSSCASVRLNGVEKLHAKYGNSKSWGETDYAKSQHSSTLGETCNAMEGLVKNKHLKEKNTLCAAKNLSSYALSEAIKNPTPHSHVTTYQAFKHNTGFEYKKGTFRQNKKDFSEDIPDPYNPKSALSSSKGQKRHSKDIPLDPEFEAMLNADIDQAQVISQEEYQESLQTQEQSSTSVENTAVSSTDVQHHVTEKAESPPSYEAATMKESHHVSDTPHMQPKMINGQARFSTSTSSGHDGVGKLSSSELTTLQDAVKNLHHHDTSVCDIDTQQPTHNATAPGMVDPQHKANNTGMTQQHQ